MSYTLTNILNPNPFSTELNLSLQESLLSVESYLDSFAHRPDFLASLRSVFGQGFTTEKATQLQQQWEMDDPDPLPLISGIEIRSWAELGGANGAYAISNGKIYLAQEFIAQNSPEQVTAALLEEYGHAVDAYLNKVDTVGDEGQLFSAVVRGQNLSAGELNAIKQEDDRSC